MFAMGPTTASEGSGDEASGRVPLRLVISTIAFSAAVRARSVCGVLPTTEYLHLAISRQLLRVKKGAQCHAVQCQRVRNVIVGHTARWIQQTELDSGGHDARQLRAQWWLDWTLSSTACMPYAYRGGHHAGVDKVCCGCVGK